MFVELCSNLECFLIYFKITRTPFFDCQNVITKLLLKILFHYNGLLLHGICLQIIGNSIIREHVNEITKEKTTDVPRKELIVICIRWVDVNLQPSKDFISLYETEKASANILVL